MCTLNVIMRILRVFGAWLGLVDVGYCDCSEVVGQGHLDGFRKCLIINPRIQKSFPAKVPTKVVYLVVGVVAMVSCPESSLCGNSFLEYFSLSLKVSFPLFFVPLCI